MEIPGPEALVKARALLEQLRRTPMSRGGRVGEPKRLLQGHIETALLEHGVPDRLAGRIAFQFVLKFEPCDLGDPTVWWALGWLVRDEVHQLQQRLRLTDRLIRVGLPKLAVPAIERLFADMQRVDARYGRTLAEAALDGAEPLAMGRRYAEAFTQAVERLSAKDPRIARTLAAAAFRSRHPLSNALTYLERYYALVDEFQGDYSFARTVARASFIAPDPIKAAKQFIRDYQTIVQQLTSRGLEPSIARTLAGIASLGGDPMRTAQQLVENFERVEQWVKRTHPTVARTIALSASRATDPLAMAHAYVENYDNIVTVMARRDPRRARLIASQAFRTNDPLAWAERFRKQLQIERQAS